MTSSATFIPTVVPDTSVWVEYLRLGERGRAGALGELLDQHRVLACGPVVAELLAGARPGDRESLGGLLAGLPWAELDHAAWRRVGHVAGELRRTGQNVPLTDIMIAVAADRVEATVWTADHDFERIASVLDGLHVRPLR